MATHNGQVALGATVDERLRASIDNWKRKLLDLSKRNRALNFKVTKVSTVAIVDELPTEVFRQLYLRAESMQFRPVDSETEEEAQAQDADPGDGPVASLYDETGAGGDPALSLDFVPYDREALHDRHTDEWLQTASTREVLDKSLRRLEEQAHSTLEEQGVNTLFLALGMVQYTEARDSEQILRAPLVLLPVELSRKGARSSYELHATDEDPIINPALSEYLRTQKVELPDLPDANGMAEDFELQTVFAAATEAIAGHKGWAVKTEIYLALFSFQKFVMYKDLEANAPALQKHRLVRQLISRTGGPTVGLPDDIRTMELDAAFPPETTYQVVDADSSQLRAMAACARDNDLVIEGPPGTGKSQTITNLIAQALAAGKSVLFVAEKMAALEVVYRRLQTIGLGEACLELHSSKANKRAVMRELALALDASLQNVAGTADAGGRLPRVRSTLTDYVRAVHTPYGTLGLTPYDAYGRLGRVYTAPRLSLKSAVDAVDRETLERTLCELADLATVAAPIGVPAEHPWRDSACTLFSEDDLEKVRAAAEVVRDRVGQLAGCAAQVARTLGVPKLDTLADAGAALEVAAVVSRSPGAPMDVLRNQAWNQAPALALKLVRRGKEAERLTARVRAHFTPDVLEQKHANDIAYVDKKSAGFFSFLAFLDGRYRSIRRRWIGYRAAGYRASVAEQSAEMKLVDSLVGEREYLRTTDEAARELFGGLWQGERSSWPALERYIEWVVEFRRTCVEHELGEAALEVAANAGPDLKLADALRDLAGNLGTDLRRLADAGSWPEDYLAQEPFAAIGQRAEALLAGLQQAPQWAAFEAARKSVAVGFAAEVLPAAMSGQVAFGDLPAAFLRGFLVKWLSAVVKEREPLQRFSTLTHEERVREFRELDQRVLRENRATLVGMLRDRVQNELKTETAVKQLPVLRKQMAAQRGLAPLRRTLRLAEAAVRAIKPCFMMSPLTVAQYLDGSTPQFDLVIFDEASQLPAEDAVGAIIRGNQLVVVGDPKQLPPTNFFAVTAGQVIAPTDDEGMPLYEDSESILEEFMGAGVPMSRLKWHYRSAHESLIHFSNVSFYDGDLYTFPSVETGTERIGLRFEYIPEGVYEGKGLNAAEARRVVDAVVEFARAQLGRAARGLPTQSLGVGTFNLRQQLAIQDELEGRRRQCPDIDSFFDRSGPEPFFVKNLENIQGDERDAIFISVTYAKAADGRLRMNFGPLNGENGWRRLNVLVTRARQRMIVFSSMRGDDINPAGATSNGPQLLRDFLLFAERGRLDGTSVSAAADTESPFERDVFNELTHRGVQVQPQVGTAGYRIDLGVLHPEVAGRFICGIECDGVAYHSSETARDRDRLRQHVLESRGWIIHRVWSTDWFKDRPGQIERLLQLIERARTAAATRDAVDDKPPAPRRASAEEASGAQSNPAPGGASSERPSPIDVRPQTSPGAGSAPAPTPPRLTYERPVAPPYAMAGVSRTFPGDLLEAPLEQVARTIQAVVEKEAPLHETDLLSRVAGIWGQRVGSRIEKRIQQVMWRLQRQGTLRRRGDFVWRASGPDTPPIRSRAGTGIPGQRIPPEEYRAAISAILLGGQALPRAQLIVEVRSVFGYARTGRLIEDAIGSVVDAMLREGTLGEASTGLCLREGNGKGGAASA